jgi:hypothetical protein
MAPALKKRMIQASLLLFVLQIAHTVDHVVGHPADAIGQIPGYLGYATVLGTLYLVASENPFGPLAATATGFFTAIGLAAIHLAPHWGIFSDPYSKLDLGFISWAIVFANLAAALWLGVLGARAMIAERSAQPAT